MIPATHLRATRRSRRRQVHRSRCRSRVRTRTWGVRPLGTIRALGDGISRDPIGESESPSLSDFLGNSPLDYIDVLGQEKRGYQGPRGPVAPAGGAKRGGPGTYNPYTPVLPRGVEFDRCWDVLTLPEMNEIRTSLSSARDLLDSVLSGAQALPPHLTVNYASCIRGKLDGYTVRCVTELHPVCLIWRREGLAIPGGNDAVIWASKLKGEPRPIYAMTLLILHEMVHSCGRWDHKGLNDPDNWAAWLTEVKPPTR